KYYEFKMIPQIDAQALSSRNPTELGKVREAVEKIGFFTLVNTAISPDEVKKTFSTYKEFFKSAEEVKHSVNMALTGSNRGWGASRSEQVDPKSNPDYKEVFDCGVEVPEDDPQAHLSVYAPNHWPQNLENFQKQTEEYFSKARRVAFDLLQGISEAVGADPHFFADKFDKPMALLRCNYYPERPINATERDFGIAPHTDYGCLTLLATDGQPGLEVEVRDGSWEAVTAEPGTFIINFGEMLEMWTDGKIIATNHRVIGTDQERLSIPLFFNPNYDTNVAPEGQEPISAGEYLSKRYNETYVHLQKAS
ncbi:MAG: 2-oxoglutarate and iron-dependent oxygenase domain-containing protein, partial [Pseudomonadota bacterium]